MTPDYSDEIRVYEMYDMVSGASTRIEIGTWKNVRIVVSEPMTAIIPGTIPMGGYKKPKPTRITQIKVAEAARKIAALGPKRSRWNR